MTRHPTGICRQCGIQFPLYEAVEEQCSGEKLTFCCNGCRGAYLLLAGAGLADIYRPVPAVGDDTSAVDDGELCAAAVRREGDDAVLTLLIDGIRCASCAFLNEKVLERLPGTGAVRVNYATGAARIRFDPAVLAPEHICAEIRRLGYVPRPYSPGSVEAAGRAERRDLLVRFGTACFLSLQLMAYSYALYAGYFQGMAPEMKRVMLWFSCLVTTPVVFYCGWPFLAGAWRGIVNRAPGMDLLIALGSLSSWGYSLYATVTGGEAYYESAAMIVTLILAGRLLELSARRRAMDGIERLLSLAPDRAARITEAGVETVPSSELHPGDLIQVGAGARFPVDGTIAAGVAEIDESPVTGEPLPVVRGAGGRVMAGSITLAALVRVRVERPAAASFIARIARQVEEAQARRAPVQQLADRITAWFVPLVVTLAVGVFVVLRLEGAVLSQAVTTAVTTLVIACPCALGLATPTAVLVGTAAAARAGILIRGGDVLERLAGIRTALFDKTGTLTEGRPDVTAVEPRGCWSASDLIAWTAAAETGSTHPVARAVQSEAELRGLEVPACGEAVTTPGGGVRAVVEDRVIIAGSSGFLLDNGIKVPENDAGGGSVVHVATDGVYRGRIVLGDRLQGDAGAALRGLETLGVRTALLSGDRSDTVRRIAQELGIGDAHGELPPERKSALLDGYRERGAVLMVGDGINDAPALVAADVGCAVAGGTDTATGSADIVLTRRDLTLVPHAVRIARRTMGVIRQNLAWALVYNMVGIPLAVSGRLTPVYASAAMAASSLCVLANSLRLARCRHE